jgi:HEAT repeat protein
MITLLRGWRTTYRGLIELRQVVELDDPLALIAFLDRAQATGGSDELKTHIILAMRRHPTEAVAERLARLLEEQPGPRVRRSIATTLGSVGTPVGRQVLRVLESDPDRNVRGLAKISLEELRRHAVFGRPS